VTYQYSLAPLSCAGSLQYIGGRFNAGVELDPNTLNPWPALYIAEDVETALREKFQLKAGELSNGLTRCELALESGGSHSTLFVHGRVMGVFDMTAVEYLEPVARELRRVAMPAEARAIRKRLHIPPSKLTMITSAKCQDPRDCSPA